MITLKTLPQATAQEVFDQVAKHLLTQMKKSASESAPDSKDYCMYRGFDGTKCAAGCLISDDEYKPEFEQKDWRSLQEEFQQMITMKHMDLIYKLQDIHDYYKPEGWRVKLNNLAEINHLKPIDF